MFRRHSKAARPFVAVRLARQDPSSHDGHSWPSDHRPQLYHRHSHRGLLIGTSAAKLVPASVPLTTNLEQFPAFLVLVPSHPLFEHGTSTQTLLSSLHPPPRGKETTATCPGKASICQSAPQICCLHFLATGQPSASPSFTLIIVSCLDYHHSRYSFCFLFFFFFLSSVLRDGRFYVASCFSFPAARQTVRVLGSSTKICYARFHVTTITDESTRLCPLRTFLIL